MAADAGTRSRSTTTAILAASPVTPRVRLVTAEPTRFASCAIHQRHGVRRRRSTYQPDPLKNGERRFVTAASISSHTFALLRAVIVSFQGCGPIIRRAREAIE